MAADFRETIGELLDELARDDLKEVVASIFSLETLRYAHCPQCQERVQITSPDYKGFASALQAFDSIGKGKQKDSEAPEVDDSKVMESLLRVMADWDVERLERLANP